MTRWAAGHVNRALEAANKLFLPLLRELRRWRELGVVSYHSETSHDRRVVLFFMDIKSAARPWMFAVYFTTQESRPLSPRDVEKRVKRLVREANQYTRGIAKDTTFMLVAAGKRTRATRGARKLLARLKMKLATPEEALETVRQYFRQRFEGMLRKIEELRGRLSPEARKRMEEMAMLFGAIAGESMALRYYLYEEHGPPTIDDGVIEEGPVEVEERIIEEDVPEVEF